MKKYQTEEERKAARAEYLREYMREYSKTPYGRASYLLRGYRQMDINKGFGDVIDFDAQWILDNIFTKKCAHCDCTDWRELGCNRINNDLPHTKDNVEPCCWEHNTELAGLSPIPIAQFDKITGELVAVWPSASEAARQLGYNVSHINECCNGKREQAYDSLWRKLSQEQYEHLESCLK